MSSGPSDRRVPEAEWATQEVKDIILDAWRPDWTKPDHPKYLEQLEKNPKAPEYAEKIAITLRDWEKPQIDQALAALEDAGYTLAKGRLVTEEELRIELRVLVNIHEFAQRPYHDQNDIKGYLTDRKRALRRQIEQAKSSTRAKKE